MLHNKENRILKIVIYVVCILLAIIYTYDQKLEDSAWKKL